jgi:hypothetical protein
MAKIDAPYFFELVDAATALYDTGLGLLTSTIGETVSTFWTMHHGKVKPTNLA